MKKVLVLGASKNPERYSYKVIKMLRERGYTVLAISRTEGIVADVSFTQKKLNFKDIDTVTLYINPRIQEEYYDYILSLSPKRIIFNPGTENTEFYEIAKNNHIKVEEACTLVLLTTNQF